MADRVGDWLALLHHLYPPHDAESWDNVGLQVGDPDDVTESVLVCLDVTPATLAEAVEQGAGLVIAHHPLLFRPLERLTPETASGRVALQAARAGVAVAAAHTNLDAAPDGTTARIMELLGVSGAVPMQPSREPGHQGTFKFVVFVPREATAAVLAAAFAAGAGQIGEYDECSFRVAGTGTFRPSADANPVVGEREQRNEVEEDRVELLVAARAWSAVMDAVIAAHPYEEVALDIYPVLNRPRRDVSTVRKGLGLFGMLADPITLAEAARRLRDGLPSPHLRVAGDPQRMIQRVAACGGAGDSLIDRALVFGADVYITGDLRHHVTLDAMTQGLALIDAGHYATEAPAMATLLDRLRDRAAERGLAARLLASALSTDPWTA
jgi:dinuclear metal center YbgI/SA1388 family protein